VKNTDSVADLEAQMEVYRPYVDYFLLDTYNANAHGGTGETFNWEIAAELAQNFPIFLAGGLNPQNAKEAAEKVKPFALDISSGVEEFPRQKDFDKLEQLFNKLRSSNI
jgi:phosphoribosylanthranilate isomerase